MKTKMSSLIHFNPSKKTQTSVALATSPVETKRQSNRDAAMAKILEAAALKREQVRFDWGKEIVSTMTIKEEKPNCFRPSSARTRLLYFPLF